MAQMTCWSRLPRVDAAVLGRPVRGLPLLLRLVSGRGVVLISSGYEVEPEVYDTRGRTRRDMIGVNVTVRARGKILSRMTLPSEPG